MFSDTITYTDFDGNERTETFYFNINEAEGTDLELRYPGGYSNKLQRDLDAGDNAAVILDFKDFLKLSYGEKSPDGKMFVKSPEIFKNFESTNAYSKIYTKLLTDPDYAMKFILAVFPGSEAEKKKASKMLERQMAEKTGETVVDNIIEADFSKETPKQ